VREKFEDDLAMTEMVSGEGERVPFTYPLYPKGNVEDWLTQVEKMMKRSVREQMDHALQVYYDMARPDWVAAENHPATAVCASSTARSTSGR
jgi:dynein heavy chain